MRFNFWLTGWEVGRFLEKKNPLALRYHMEPGLFVYVRASTNPLSEQETGRLPTVSLGT